MQINDPFERLTDLVDRLVEISDPYFAALEVVTGGMTEACDAIEQRIELARAADPSDPSIELVATLIAGYRMQIDEGIRQVSQFKVFRAAQNKEYQS